MPAWDFAPAQSLACESQRKAAPSDLRFWIIEAGRLESRPHIPHLRLWRWSGCSAGPPTCGFGLLKSADWRVGPTFPIKLHAGRAGERATRYGLRATGWAGDRATVYALPGGRAALTRLIRAG